MNFLHAGANLNLLTNNGESPLLLVCKYAPVYTGITVNQLVTDSVLKPLVEAGADVNAKTVDGTTPLHLVTLSQPMDAMEHLIAKGANVSHREKIFGFTALHMAAMQRHESKLEYLLRRRRRLDVNDGGYYGITAFHLASFCGNVKFMSKLIDHGADVHCRDRESRSTTLHFVAKDGYILNYISLICNVEDEPFWNPKIFTFGKGKAAVQLLVDRGVDVNAKDIFGRTPLHVATMYVVKEKNDGPLQPIRGDDFDDQIRALLNNGAHMDVQDYEGNLPIHNALITRHEEALKSLLEFGVDVNEADTCRIVMNSEENMKALVIEYLVKLKVAKLPVSDAYRFDMGDDTKSLENEVKQMQSHLLDDTTSLYDLLHMGWRQRSNFEPKLPDDLKEKFPLYAGIIRARCRDAEQKRLLFEVINLRWHLISEVILPDIIVDFILELLGIRNLRVLVEALS